MIAVIQRVNRGRVSVAGEVTGSIERGLVLLLGVFHYDTEEDARVLADKCAFLRIFNDENGKMNLSVLDVKGDILAVSQFTLCGDCKKGRRPSFINAAPPEMAEELYEKFIEYLKNHNLRVETGIFGAMMDVEIVNDGPVTFVLDSRELKRKK